MHIHSTIAINFISTTDVDEEHVTHLKIDYIKIMIYDKADEVIQELSESLLNRCQIELETSVKGSILSLSVLICSLWIEISKEHQQKEHPYRKTLSKGQFTISIVSTSTSRNTNIVFPDKLCSKSINDWDAVIQCEVYIWGVINLTLLSINISKDQLILGFVYHVVVQFYHLEIW